MEAIVDVAKGCYNAIHGHETFKKLMACNNRPTVGDGENLLVLLSVIHDELKTVLNK